MFFCHKLFFVPSPLTPCAVTKSMISLAAFLGRSSDTEWPQVSIRSTWQFGRAACSTAAPVTCSTCECRCLTEQQIQLERHTRHLASIDPEEIIHLRWNLLNGHFIFYIIHGCFSRRQTLLHKDNLKHDTVWRNSSASPQGINTSSSLPHMTCTGAVMSCMFSCSEWRESSLTSSMNTKQCKHILYTEHEFELKWQTGWGGCWGRYQHSL